MRKLNTLLGVTLTAFAFGAGALHSHAAEPKKARADVCKTQAGVTCAPYKRISQTQQAAPASVSKALLNRNICGRLQSQLERDTCLNRVEATA